MKSGKGVVLVVTWLLFAAAVFSTAAGALPADGASTADAPAAYEGAPADESEAPSEAPSDAPSQTPGEKTGSPAKKNIWIVTPYLGTIKDVYVNEERGIELEDSSLMKGLYLQWIRPDLFQSNLFVYQSSDINYSTLWGGHFIFDYYFDVAEKHKNVIGAGVDIIRIDMDAGSSIAGLSDFTLLNTIYVPFIRVGRYFLFGSRRTGMGGAGKYGFSVLPWLGVDYEIVEGDLSLDPTGPAPPQQQDIDDRRVFPLAGLNLKGNFFHFLEGEFKYLARFDADDYFNDLSVIVNVFFSRHWGGSYRYMHMENLSGVITYHIWGISLVF